MDRNRGETDSVSTATSADAKAQRAREDLLDRERKFAFEQVVTHVIYDEERIEKVAAWSRGHSSAAMAGSTYSVIYQRILRDERRRAVELCPPVLRSDAATSGSRLESALCRLPPA